MIVSKTQTLKTPSGFLSLWMCCAKKSKMLFNYQLENSVLLLSLPWRWGTNQTLWFRISSSTSSGHYVVIQSSTSLFIWFGLGFHLQIWNVSAQLQKRNLSFRPEWVWKGYFFLFFCGQSPFLFSLVREARLTLTHCISAFGSGNWGGQRRISRR